MVSAAAPAAPAASNFIVVFAIIVIISSVHVLLSNLAETFRCYINTRIAQLFVLIHRSVITAPTSVYTFSIRILNDIVKKPYA